jgi:hypothetical protein
MPYVIQERNGTFYRQMNTTGPCFGAPLTEAALFTTQAEATVTLQSSPGFAYSKVVPLGTT